MDLCPLFHNLQSIRTGKALTTKAHVVLKDVEKIIQRYEKWQMTFIRDKCQIIYFEIMNKHFMYKMCFEPLQIMSEEKLLLFALPVTQNIQSNVYILDKKISWSSGS